MLEMHEVQYYYSDFFKKYINWKLDANIITKNDLK